MKHIAILALGVVFATYTPEAHAQAFLKGLADKAKSKIEKKVENAAGNAVGKVLNGKSKQDAKNSTTSSGSNSEGVVTTYGTHAPDEDPFLTHVNGLTAPENTLELQNVYRNIEIDEEKETKFLSYDDAAKAFPSLPTGVQIINLDAAPVQATHDFNNGCIHLSTIIAEAVTKAQLKAGSKASGNKVSAAQAAQMNASATQIFQLMQKHGIDPEKTSDEEMEAFVKKMIASGELKIPTSGGVIKTNYTDEQETAIDNMSSKIDVLEKKVSTLIADNQHAFVSLSNDEKMRGLYADLQSKWKGSEAYKQVYDIEKDIDKRALQYIENHPDYRDNGATITYPDFWVEGRKKENEIIRNFNIANAEMWLKEFAEAQKSLQTMYQEIAVTDHELESTFSDKEDPIYAILKHRIMVTFQQLVIYFPVFRINIYSMPLVQSVSENKILAQ